MKDSFTPMPNTLFGGNELTKTDVMVLMAIAHFDRMGVNGRGCFAGEKTLAELIACSERSVRRSVDVLSRTGYIRSERNSRDRRRVVLRVLYKVPANLVRYLEPESVGLQDSPVLHQASAADEIQDEPVRHSASIPDHPVQYTGQACPEYRTETPHKPLIQNDNISYKQNKKQNKKQISRSDEADPAQAASTQKIDANSKAVFDRLLAAPVIDGWLARVERFLPEATEAQLLELTWKLEEWAEGHGEGEPIHGRARRLAVQAHDLIQQMERTAP